MLRYLSHQSSFLSSRFTINWHHVSLFRRLANWKWVLQIYESPEDLDLWSAGVTERPLPGSMVSFIKLKWIECFFIFIHIYEGWSHLGVHYRETVPQLPTGRSVLVRERWLAFLLHSWTGQSLFFLLMGSTTHRSSHSSWRKSEKWSFPVWSATTLTRSRTSRCTPWSSPTTRSTQGFPATPTSFRGLI